VMKRNIQYGIEKDTGLVISRVGSEIAWPMLRYEAMRPENDFAPSYALGRLPVSALTDMWQGIEWTRKIPVELKNRHRAFWGFQLIESIGE
jgi:hypothetical protein